jgi:hypothetical protein
MTTYITKGLSDVSFPPTKRVPRALRNPVLIVPRAAARHSRVHALR